jgi:hypothetical protein
MATSRTANGDRVTTGAAAVAVELALIVTSPISLPVACLSVVSLMAAMLSRRTEPALCALALLIAAYAVGLEGRPDPLAGIRVGGFVLVAELAWWSIEVPRGAAVESGLAIRRALDVVILSSVGALLASVAILAARVISEPTTVLRLVSIAAAGAGLVIAVPELAQRRVDSDRSDEARSDHGTRR